MEFSKQLQVKGLAYYLNSAEGRAEMKSIQERHSYEARNFLSFKGFNPGLAHDALEVIRVRDAQEYCENGCPGVESCRNSGFTQEIQEHGGRIHVTTRRCDQLSTHIEQVKIIEQLGSLPAALAKKSFRNFNVRERSQKVVEARKAAIKAQENGDSIIFAGGVGTGKTHLAAAILAHSMHDGKSGCFTSVPEMIVALKDFGVSGKYRERLETIKRSEILVLDDLGAENTTPWVQEQLFVLIDYRCVHELQTIVTTNFISPSELIVKLAGERSDCGVHGERIVSRLQEMCGDWVVIVGDDYRLEKVS